MNSWAITLARDDANSVAALRLAPDVEVGEAGNALWLRGRHSDEQLQSKLNRLPAVARYEWLAPDLLRLVDRRIAVDRLPKLSWQPLPAWLKVASPVAAPSAEPPPSVPLRLVRSSDEREPELLLARLEDFQQFADDAAEVRLSRLQFAANDQGEVIIRGKPLPPLPGRRFVLHGGVAVPAGFSWAPAVSAEIVARSFSTSGDALVVWNENNMLSRLNAEQFVPASRSALRATAIAGASENQTP